MQITKKVLWAVVLFAPLLILSAGNAFAKY